MKRFVVTTTPYLTKISAVLAVVIALCALAYGVFLLEAVANAAERTAAERHVRDLTSRVSALEEQYLAVARTLTPDLARSMGFVAPERTTTVFATNASRSLSASVGVAREVVPVR